MCAERRLTSGELDELILKCLADGMGLHRIMQELYGACVVWLAVFDTSSGTISACLTATRAAWTC